MVKNFIVNKPILTLTSVPKLGKNLNHRANRPPFETNLVSVAAVAEIASQVPVDDVPYTTHHTPSPMIRFPLLTPNRDILQIWRVILRPSLHLVGRIGNR